MPVGVLTAGCPRLALVITNLGGKIVPSTGLTASGNHSKMKEIETSGSIPDYKEERLRREEYAPEQAAETPGS